MRCACLLPSLSLRTHFAYPVRDGSGWVDQGTTWILVGRVPPYEVMSTDRRKSPANNDGCYKYQCRNCSNSCNMGQNNVCDVHDYIVCQQIDPGPVYRISQTRHTVRHDGIFSSCDIVGLSFRGSTLTSDCKLDDVADFITGSAPVTDTLVVAWILASHRSKRHCLITLIEVSTHADRLQNLSVQDSQTVFLEKSVF